jgi:hypothetical protein
VGESAEHCAKARGYAGVIEPEAAALPINPNDAPS